jgi:hypothetical protein
MQTKGLVVRLDQADLCAQKRVIVNKIKDIISQSALELKQELIVKYVWVLF